MDESVKHAYENSLRDIEHRCSDAKRQLAVLQNKVRQLHQAAQTISMLLHEDDGTQMLLPLPDSMKYADLSVRWAILKLLTETNQPFTVQEIADALIAGGIRTEASNFANNVSSVLSQMRSKAEPEVATAAGKWVISENGRGAWLHIRTKLALRARKRVSPSWVEAPNTEVFGA